MSEHGSPGGLKSSWGDVGSMDGVKNKQLVISRRVLSTEESEQKLNLDEEVIERP